MRQAIAHAINKKAIVDAFYGGLGLVAKQLQPPALWGYNKEIKDYEYSPAKAQDLLKQAGFANGFSEITWQDGKKEPLVLWYMPRSRPYYPSPKEIAEAMAADLAKAGIKAQLQTVEWANYLEKRKKGEMPLYMIGWTGDNGDPDNFVCFFFCPTNVPREGFYNNLPLSDVLKRAATLSEPGRAGQAVPPGRADDPRRRGAYLRRERRAPAGLLEEGQGLRDEPDRDGVLQHGRGSVEVLSPKEGGER